MDAMKGAVYAACVLTGKEVEEGEEAVSVRLQDSSASRAARPAAAPPAGTPAPEAAPAWLAAPPRPAQLPLQPSRRADLRNADLAMGCLASPLERLEYT
jgi:hypothetical protein